MQGELQQTMSCVVNKAAKGKHTTIQEIVYDDGGGGSASGANRRRRLLAMCSK